VDRWDADANRCKSEPEMVWRYPEKEYHEDCCRVTVISGFEKVKGWAGMRYGKLSKLVEVLKRKGGEKMNSEDYVDFIIDREMFDFWIESCEELGQVIMMEDGASYHKGVAKVRREQLEKDGGRAGGQELGPLVLLI
jgi:hypothetical protein